MRQRTILITGAAGAVGGNLTSKILSLNKKNGGQNSLHLLIKPSSDTWRISNLLSQTTVHSVDLTNYQELLRVFEKANPDLIINCASYKKHPADQSSKSQALFNNPQSILNLLEASKIFPPKMFIHIGSCLEYGRINKLSTNEQYQEDKQCQPKIFRGALKNIETTLIKQYCEEFNLPVNIIRTSNVYGPFEQPDRLIPTIIKNIAKGIPIRLTVNKTYRDFIYVDDLTEGIIQLAGKEEFKGEIFNICSGQLNSNHQVLEIIKKTLQKEPQILKEPHLGTVADNSIYPISILKAKSLLNWSPKHSLEDGIQKTCLWFLETGLNLPAYS
ncbi:MAG TPA: NAD(P)-dependent oxidoreductase [Oligoflexia bacterium]|nr:NAD(P)-dependent oxidoreductase [Oligoflexia bacterium]HMP27283.1 NAD(P)-dependent oxidoreductase [Oligoflexia bacterium]